MVLVIWLYQIYFLARMFLTLTLYFQIDSMQPLANEIIKLIEDCLKLEPSERPTADELVMRCGELCYPVSTRVFGVIGDTRVKYGFIRVLHLRTSFSTM